MKRHPSRVDRPLSTVGPERAPDRPGPFPGSIGPTVCVAILAAVVAGAALRMTPPPRPALAQSSLSAPSGAATPLPTTASDQRAATPPAAVQISQVPAIDAVQPTTLPGPGPTPGTTSAPSAPPSPGPRSAAPLADPFGPGFPRRTVSAAAPLRVLVVGDSVMLGAEIAIAAALEATGVVVVEQVAVTDLGLSRLDAYDWRSEWPAIIERVDPEVVIVHVGPGDGAAVDANGQHWYQGIVEHAVRILGAGGAEIVWVGAAPNAWFLDDERARHAVNEVFAQLPTRFADVVSYVAPEPFLTGVDGRFAFDLPGPDGATERVRMSDGVHLCPSGAARFARATLQSLSEHWDLPEPVEAWSTDEWTLDPRFAPAALGPCPSPDA